MRKPVADTDIIWATCMICSVLLFAFFTLAKSVRGLTAELRAFRKGLPHFTANTNGFTYFAEGEP